VRRAEAYALRHAADVVAVSAFTAAKTAEIFGLKRTIGVVPNGIDVAQFSPASESETDSHAVLYFGTLARKKGVLDLPAIFARLVEARPEARLLLLGRDNPDRASRAASTWSLIEAALPAGCRSEVHYLGSQPYDRVQNYIRKAGVCVFPTYAEAFPLSWLEAMACAKTVVAYDIGWAREVIESGRSGLLIPAGNTAAFADALAGLIAAPEECRRLGCEARRRVEGLFSSDVVARQTLAWYAGVLARDK
jgi:glycosyltransferase involved in cell wall biosynthesis